LIFISRLFLLIFLFLETVSFFKKTFIPRVLNPSKKAPTFRNREVLENGRVLKKAFPKLWGFKEKNSLGF
jgi:hypothetical protein